MPVAPVNNAGAVMHYEDSGAPPGASLYTTVVIIHGFMFHGAGFIPMFPYAAAHNLRIFTVNLRDYPGSTPYTPFELDRLCSTNVEDQRIAVRAQGQEIAAFLKHIILSENLPCIEELGGKNTGGIVLLSWSLGNIWSLSMFGNAEYLDEDTQSILRRYLRTLVMYVPPHYPLGVEAPPEILEFGRNPALNADDDGNSFGRWVSDFFTPQHELTGDLAILARRVPVHGSPSEVGADPRFVPTIDCMTPEELASIADPGVLGRSGRCLKTTDSRVWWDNAQRALFDCGEQEGDSAPFSGVNVVVLWCDMGPGPGPFTANHIAERLKEVGEEGKVTRNVAIVKIEQANHLIHWHEPERFVRIVVDNLQ